ncbi:MAG: hypothetical protein Q8K13_11530, partial [Parvibaculum sp.]|uniref:hypothetical protein n=1 Tax=Parvibaculum sp. TaxID=2024848 RepID=UPI0027315BAB
EFDRLLGDFNKGGPPSFKETASFIRATQSTVEHLDMHYLQKIIPALYLKSFLRFYMKELPPLQQKKVVQSIWGQDASVRKKKVISFLVNNCGLSADKKYAYSATITEDALDQLAHLTPKVFFEQYMAD